MEVVIVVDRLELGRVRLPPAHPRAAEGTCVIHGFVIRHPDGVILVDTGTADDHDALNDLFHPIVTPIIDALHAINVDERDVTAIVNTHLHFDHCGQNRALPDVPVWVQAAEYALVDQPHFTIPEWASIPTERRRLVDGDAVLAEGVRLVATPGHTPGHQSVVIDRSDGDAGDDGDDATGAEIIVGQTCYTCAEFIDGRPADTDMYGDEWISVGRQSLARLRSFDASTAHFSHDPTVFRRPA